MYGVPNDGVSITGSDNQSGEGGEGSGRVADGQAEAGGGLGVRVGGGNVEPNRLLVKVLTFNRPKPLKRLLSSLSESDFRGDVADVEIWVDGPRGGRSTPERDEVISFAKRFKWAYGKVDVIVRDENVGLVGNWLGCWSDVSPEDFQTAVLILEDDMEVSPLFWRWLKQAWGKYALRSDLAGVSLQHQHTRSSDGSSSFHVSNGDAPYLYKIPGSWGFSPHPKAWRSFLDWQKDKANSGYEPNTLQFKGKDVITTKWWKDMKGQGKDPRMWTQWYMT